ncbi:protein XRP2-like [Amphiura filiformis]|uniref:protein XRP2-like n=1 Tax=Amphiura filiformis TaxID=82378 RepID=UPI003B213459
MGCLFSRSSNDAPKEEETPKVFSWDKKDRPDPKDFTIEKLNGETAGRIPGKINGQQFIINQCEDCNIYIFDHNATITVDNCTNCRIFIGPSKGSIFLRNCKDCKCVIACQQFRTRDCRNMDVLLHCDSQPIIEATTKIRFGCFRYYYPELLDQFKSAGLSVYNNTWSNIHDFSPVPGEDNWTLISQDFKMEDYVPAPSSEEFSSMKISTAPDDSVVPFTQGNKRRKAEQACLVVFFKDDGSEERIRNFVKGITKEGSCTLVQSKEIEIDGDDTTRLFVEDQQLADAAGKGPVVSLEYSGANAVQVCQDVLQPLIGESVVFVSTADEAGNKVMENWNNHLECQMGM